MDNYEKTSEYLICIDSDGCVMDTMNLKHKHCFGPKVVELFDLEDNEGLVLGLWNEINLYSKTRGINRFKGLLKLLLVLADHNIVIEDLEVLRDFVENAQALGNPALAKELLINDTEILKKAYAWSLETNACIDSLPKGDDIFFEAVESLINASSKADIAVVSAANSEALFEEWERLGVSEYPKIICGQEMGSKSSILKSLLAKGYDKDKVLMIGDAFGDLEAARDNGICFYPIVVRAENAAWEEFRNVVLPAFITGNYQDLEADYIFEMRRVLK